MHHTTRTLLAPPEFDHLLWSLITYFKIGYKQLTKGLSKELSCSLRRELQDRNSHRKIRKRENAR